MKKITSIQNPFAKFLVSLRDKSKVRKEKNQFLIEGKREIFLSIQGGYEIEKILVCFDFFDVSDLKKIPENLELIEITKEIFEKLSYRKKFDGLLAVANKKDHKLLNLNIGDNPLVLVVENIEKPGNIGAILRTCDAANIDAVFIADQGVDSDGNLTAFASTHTVTGATSSATGTPSSHDTTPELTHDTGDILYIENRKPISRAADQTENVKLIVEF